MKKGRAFYAVKFISTVIMFAGIMTGRAFAGETGNKEVSIGFIHDLHSHFEAVMTEDGERGSVSRIKTVFDKIRRENANAVIVDAGDFSMGTLFQSMYKERAYEYTMLGYLGVDATTLGNHEFDYTGIGVAQMLTAAKKTQEELSDTGFKLPKLLISNVDWDKSDKETSQALSEALEGDNFEYMLLEKNGIKILIYGIMGEDSAACAPDSGLIFKDIISTSKELVPRLKKETGAELVICLSHSGTSSDPKLSEDELLAEAVPEIDVIISGHTHTTLTEPIISDNGTIVVSSGCYGDNVGNILLTQNSDESWSLTNYELISIDETIEKDKQIEEIIEKYKGEISGSYLAKLGFKYDEVLAYNPYDMGTVDELYSSDEEIVLGSFIADSYIHTIKEAEGENYEEIAVAFVPTGVVREAINVGEVTVADAFSVLSLGIGSDDLAGYPLVSCYLTGKELKTAAEVDASVSDLMAGAGLSTRGLNFTFNPNRLFLNRVTEVYLEKEDGTREEIDNKKLYRVVADLYTAKMLGSVKSKSFGLLSVEPKDKGGNPIKDFDAEIISSEGKEIKAWTALANYLGDTEVVPQYYSAAHGRKAVDDSKNIIDLIKNPNKIMFMLIGIIIILIAAIILIIKVIIMIYKRVLQKK